MNWKQISPDGLGLPDRSYYYREPNHAVIIFCLVTLLVWGPPVSSKWNVTHWYNNHRSGPYFSSIAVDLISSFFHWFHLYIYLFIHSFIHWLTYFLLFFFHIFTFIIIINRYFLRFLEDLYMYGYVERTRTKNQWYNRQTAHHRAIILSSKNLIHLIFSFRLILIIITIITIVTLIKLPLLRPIISESWILSLSFSNSLILPHSDLIWFFFVSFSLSLSLSLRWVSTHYFHFGKQKRIYLFCCSARCTKEAADAARGWYFLVFGLLIPFRLNDVLLNASSLARLIGAAWPLSLWTWPHLPLPDPRPLLIHCPKSLRIQWSAISHFFASETWQRCREKRRCIRQLFVTVAFHAPLAHLSSLVCQKKKYIIIHFRKFKSFRSYRLRRYGRVSANLHRS